MGARSGGGGGAGMGRGGGANMYSTPRGVPKNYSVTVLGKGAPGGKYSVMWKGTNEQGKAQMNHYFTNKQSDLNKFIKNNLTANGYQSGSVW